MVEDMHPANGRVTIREVYGLIKESHSELGEKIDRLCERFDEHISEAHERDIDIQRLKDYTSGCTERFKALVEHEHAERHAEYEKNHHEQYVHLTPSDIDARMKDRDQILAQVKSLTDRAPRRKTDPDTENWGNSVFEDKEVGDMKRAWRVLKWLVVTAISPVIVALGLELQERIF